MMYLILAIVTKQNYDAILQEGCAHNDSHRQMIKANMHKNDEEKGKLANPTELVVKDNILQISHRLMNVSQEGCV